MVVVILGEYSRETISSTSKGRNYGVFLESSDGRKYFFKEQADIQIFKELLAQEIAELLQIRHINYNPFVYDGKKGLISENFIKKGYEYLSGSEFIDSYINDTEKEKIDLDDDTNSDSDLPAPDLYIIWRAIEKKFKNYPNYEEQAEKIMNDIIDMSMYDMIIINFDRNPDNWFIEFNDSNFRIVNIFDHELAFSTFCGSALNTKWGMFKNTVALENLIDESDDSIKDRFINFLNIINPRKIYTVVDETLKKYNLCADKDFINDVINNFISNYHSLAEVISNLNQSSLTDFESESKSQVM